MGIDKKAMVEALVFHYTNGNKAQFASILGVSAQTISAWIARNTFDAELVFTKCSDVSAEWLLTGHGSMLRDERPASAIEPTVIYKSDPKDAKIIALQEDKIKMLEEKLRDRSAVLDNAPTVDVTSAGARIQPSTK